MTIPTFSRRTLALLSLGSAAVLFVSVNVIANHVLRSARIDLTADHVYTLSDGTARTLAEIQEPLTLRFYYSRRLGDEIPSYGIYAQRVRETLEEYAARAQGKIDLQAIDPEPFSPEEDRAVALGLQGVPLEQGGEKVYFGLAATNSTDDQELIPFFQPERERFLEYDLTKMIHSIARPKKTVVGLVTALPLEGNFAAALQGQPLRPYAIVNQLRQLYELRTISTEFDKVEPDIDVLLIVHPQGLSDKTLYAIDQFVLGGGRALVFVDPHSETQQMHPNPYAQQQGGEPVDSDLEPLFKAWGVELEPKVVAGDRQAARRVNIGSANAPQPLDYVAWLQLKDEALNHDDLVTGDLDQINMASAGILKPTKDAKTSFVPLIQTSTDSEEIPVDKVEGMPDVAGLLDDFKPTGQRYVLAARISGPAQTAFPDGPPKPKEEQKSSDAQPADDTAKKDDPTKPADVPQIKEAKQPINVIVVGDTDLLDDRFWAQTSEFFGQQVVVPTASNGDFVANALEVLAGGNDLISLRSRGTAARPFVVVDRIQHAAEAQNRANEKALQDKLKATEDKIKDIQQNKEGTVTLTAEQTQAIDNFRGEMLRTRQQLRVVQRALRQDIDRLKAEVEFFDIAFIPILVGFVAVVLGVVRINRRKRPTVHA
ncbi:MAG TPA: Gldg family protein [Stellaceae bacterium]|nr:Gldg family protein [Stellaceae bacterium]